MDYAISNWINDTFGQNKVFVTIWKIITYCGGTAFILGAIALLLVFKKTRKIGFYALVACGVAYVFGDIILKNIIQRNRPFVQYPELANMCNLVGYKFPKGFSMPSGHSLVSMTLAVSIFCFSKKWGSLAIIHSIFVGLSRVILCVHFMTDVLVGWTLGVIIGVALHFLAKWFINLFIKWREKHNGKNSVSNN